MGARHEEARELLRLLDHGLEAWRSRKLAARAMDLNAGLEQPGDDGRRREPRHDLTDALRDLKLALVDLVYWAHGFMVRPGSSAQEVPTAY